MPDLLLDGPQVAPLRHTKGPLHPKRGMQFSQKNNVKVLTIKSRAIKESCHRHGFHLKLNFLFLLQKMERAMGFEPTTSTLARLRSTPELRPQR